MGVANREDALNLLEDLEEQLVNLQRRIDKDLPREEAELRASLGGLVGKERKEHLRKINEYSSGQIKNDLELTIRARKTQIARITKSLKSAGNKLYTGKGDDDVMVGEIHLVKDKPVTLKFRARDVIHSAYLPYFRAQMNVVPGLPTEFTFVPTKSTKEMRDDKNDPEWNYYLVCNKICGNSHFNMKIIVIVEDQTSYDEWPKTQNPLFAEKETQPTEQSEGEMKEQSDSTENVVEGDEIVIN
jgi:heme/copper-type cytochrome/quinol oxidase subunit 2